MTDPDLDHLQRRVARLEWAVIALAGIILGVFIARVIVIVLKWQDWVFW